MTSSTLDELFTFYVAPGVALVCLVVVVVYLGAYLLRVGADIAAAWRRERAWRRLERGGR